MIDIEMINKQEPSLGRNRFSALLFIYIIYILAIIHTYDSQIAKDNVYAGLHPWEITGIGWIYLFIVSISIVFIVSSLKGNPSDFFIILYSFISIASFLSLTSTSGRVSESTLLPSLTVIILPIVSVFLAQNFLPKTKWRGIVSTNIIIRVILGVMALSIFYSYLNSPEGAGFDIINSYDRRLKGRDIYADGSLIAYALAMSMNGIAPYLAFKSIVNKHKVLIFIAFGSAIYYYWLIGVKAPMAYVIISCLVGYLTRRNYLKYFAEYFLIGVVGLYFLVLIEWLFFENYSIIADYFFRRLFSVQAEIQGYYLDFLFVNTPSFWSFLSGSDDKLFAATFYIGESYQGNPDSNANTNAFLHAFIKNGIIGYLVAIFFVSIFLVLLDRLYRSTKNPAYMLIGFVYAYLVIEQAFTTALLSSGVGLLFILTLFEKFDSSIAHDNYTNSL